MRKEGSVSLVVNTAKGIPKDQPSSSSCESLLEKYLAESGWLASTFGLNKDRVGRQFPVGLFDGKVSNGSSIFTGGKSAIDLVGLDELSNRLWLFELKANGNQSMGMVSELLFYVHFVLDVLNRHFKFDAQKKASKIKGRLHHQELTSAEVTELIGCFLAPAFHPLLEHYSVISLLNSSKWECVENAVKVRFCLEQLPSTLVTLATLKHQCAESIECQ